MHVQVYDFCSQYASSTLEGSGLEIGGRDLNGNARGLWPNVAWEVLDILPGPDVDIVADARTWMPDKDYEIVLCTEVLEHVQDWRLIINTAAKALAPGGRLVITCAGPGRPIHSGIDATAILPGEYYRNVSPADLHEALRLSGLDIGTCRQMSLDTQAFATKPLR